MSASGACSDATTADPMWWAPDSVRDALLLVLAFASGSNDAIVYLSLGHVFTANMTGNTVLLGIAIAQAQWPAVLRSGVALAGYVAGVAIGSAILFRADRRGIWPPIVTIACAVELLILLAFTIWGVAIGSAHSASGAVYPLIALSAVAMGIQSITVRTLGVSSVTTTYITGTWTSLIAGLAIRLIPLRRLREARDADDEDLPTRETGLQGAVVAVYLLAALAGAVGALRFHLSALALPCAAVALVVVVARQRFHH